MNPKIVSAGLIGLVALVLVVVSLGTDGGAEAARPQAFMSLGDSLAYGEGAEQPAEGGFAARLYDSLQPGNETASATPGDFINLAKPGGVTSGQMVTGQLQQAVTEIAGRAETEKLVDDVMFIAVSIGGNDFFDLVGTCQGSTFPIDPDSACAQALLRTFADYSSNLATILADLRSAAGPEAKLAIMTYYNSLPACYLSDLAPLAELALEGDGGSIPGLNNVIRAIANANDVAIAEGYGLLGETDFVGGEDCLHPNDSGHAKLAAAFLSALDDE